MNAYIQRVLDETKKKNAGEPEFLQTVEEVLKEGQEVEVKIIDIDTKSNKIRLSRKALLPKPEKPHHKREEREENANGTENTPQAE